MPWIRSTDRQPEKTGAYRVMAMGRESKGWYDPRMGWSAEKPPEYWFDPAPKRRQTGDKQQKLFG